jgi:hypothetical protein
VSEDEVGGLQKLVTDNLDQLGFNKLMHLGAVGREYDISTSDDLLSTCGRLARALKDGYDHIVYLILNGAGSCPASSHGRSLSLRAPGVSKMHVDWGRSMATLKPLAVAFPSQGAGWHGSP